MLLRQIGVADVELARLHKVGAMEFKPPESCSQSNYTKLLLFIRGCYLYRLLSNHSSLYLYFPKD